MTQRTNSSLLFLYSFILYLPSTAILPASTYYVISLGVFLYRFCNNGFNNEFYFITSFFLISLFISLLSIPFADHELRYYNNFIPLQLSLISSLVIATSITKKIAYYLIIFILVECFSGYLQILLGLKTFFPFVSVAIPEMGDPHGLLYYMRVYGFGENSSGFAGNVIIMATLFSLFFCEQPRRIKVMVFTFSLFALIVSFSRSGLFAYALLLLVIFVKDFKINHLKFLLPTVFVCIIASYYFVDWGDFFSQLSRGRGHVDITGRDLIWSYYFQEIGQNPIFGNGSLRNYLFVPPYGLMHAHNSYIMLLYVLGILPLFFMIFPIFLLAIRKFRLFIFLIALLTYSFAQYFLFWGASLADIIFFSVLVSHRFKNVAPVRNSTVRIYPSH